MAAPEGSRPVPVMRVISDRDLAGKTVLSRFSDAPLLRGSHGTPMWCGHCGQVVLDGVDLEPLRELVFRCNCGAYNVAPPR